MPRVSRAFFTLAVLCCLSGMLLGMRMGATQDFTMHPVHAHLNLVGWASLALMGTYYTLDRAAVGRLAWVNFVFSGLGAIVLPLGIFMVASGHPNPGETIAMLGGMLALVGIALFLLAVLGGWRRTSDA
jgi:hypothetical protein